MADLLSCPFCGGEAESDHLRGYLTMMGGRLDHGAAIYCTSCHSDMMICRADTREWSDEERMAVLREAWNRRASPAPVAVPAGYRLTRDAPWTSRLARTQQRTATERQCGELIAAIESLGAHPLLTDALNAADLAMRVLGRWHDEGEPGRSSSASPVPSTATQAGAVTRAGDETDGGA